MDIDIDIFIDQADPILKFAHLPIVGCIHDGLVYNEM